MKITDKCRRDDWILVEFFYPTQNKPEKWIVTALVVPLNELKYRLTISLSAGFRLTLDDVLCLLFRKLLTYIRHCTSLHVCYHKRVYKAFARTQFSACLYICGLNLFASSASRVLHRWLLVNYFYAKHLFSHEYGGWCLGGIFFVTFSRNLQLILFKTSGKLMPRKDNANSS